MKIRKKGWLLASEREKTLPIRNISSVEVKKPGAFASGFIQFSIAGGVSRNSSFTFTGGAFDAAQDENSVVFRDDVAYRSALKIKNYVESYRDPTVAAPAPAAATSAADEIMKMKRLLDQGIISREEFEVLKKRLLMGEL